MTDPQQLRAIVAAWWEDTFVNDYVIDRSGNYRSAEDCIEDIVIRARAALAEETAAPAVMEIIKLSEEIEAAGLGQVDFARAVLARWGRPAPAPPADGEVAELAAWLYQLADQRSCNRRRGIRPHPSALTRAAVLLERYASPACVVLNPSHELIEALENAPPGRIELVPDDTQCVPLPEVGE